MHHGGGLYRSSAAILYQLLYVGNINNSSTLAYHMNLYCRIRFFPLAYTRVHAVEDIVETGYK